MQRRFELTIGLLLDVRDDLPLKGDSEGERFMNEKHRLLMKAILENPKAFQRMVEYQMRVFFENYSQWGPEIVEFRDGFDAVEPAIERIPAEHRQWFLETERDNLFYENNAEVFGAFEIALETYTIGEVNENYEPVTSEVFKDDSE